MLKRLLAAAGIKGRRPGDYPDLEELKRGLEACGEKELVALAPFISAAIARAGVQEGWVNIKLFKEFERRGFHVTSNSFYSPVPDTTSLPDALWEGEVYVDALATVNVTEQFGVLKRITAWSDELKETPSSYSDDFFWDNNMFPPLDAITYYGFIREHKPRNVLEVGCGYSTEVALLAAARNGTTDVSCIEPFPSPRLLARRPETKDFITARAQDVPLEVYTGLKEGDILFVDTSHVLKLGSDVNHILFNVLPHIEKGVIVHFHDVFIPYEYPREWVDETGIFWNEHHALLSFLMYNSGFRVLLLNYAASVKYEKFLSERLGGLDIWGVRRNLGGARGAGLWMVKE